MKSGAIQSGAVLEHEGVGIVEDLGRGVRNPNVGDRVVIPSTNPCSYSTYCRSGSYSQCDVANPDGASSGMAYFGGPASSVPFDGLQAKYAHIPYAGVGLFKLPEEVSDEQASTLSGIFYACLFRRKVG